MIFDGPEVLMKPNTGTKKNITDDERRLLIFRAAELSARSENFAVASSFLTPAEQRIVFESLRKGGGAERLFFWGGFIGAERRMAIFLPSWMEGAESVPQSLYSEEREKYFVSLLKNYGAEDTASEFMTPLLLRKSGYVELSHRDWLGAFMALGIKRSVLGDIVSDGENDYAMVENGCADFMVAELCHAGRDTVSCEKISLSEDFAPRRNFQELSFTVASPRADGIVKSLCGISREKAAEAITGGMAELNYFPLTDTDKHVAAGDILSVRGYGKYIVDSADETTAKGRIRVRVRKYI